MSRDIFGEVNRCIECDGIIRGSGIKYCHKHRSLGKEGGRNYKNPFRETQEIGFVFILIFSIFIIIGLGYFVYYFIKKHWIYILLLLISLGIILYKKIKEKCKEIKKKYKENFIKSCIPLGIIFFSMGAFLFNFSKLSTLEGMSYSGVILIILGIILFAIGIKIKFTKKNENK